IPKIKAKIDTGARTSAVHAFVVEPFYSGKQLKVRFGVHPLQKRTDIELYCEANVIDRRLVSDSGGHRERRYVIRTPVQIGTYTWPIEITLTDRDTMRFRMLLGRSAMCQSIMVNPNASYLLGRISDQSYT
ncbi:MAG: ribosomal protein S6 modification protein, partial [Candidatus Entotheonella factor]